MPMNLRTGVLVVGSLDWESRKYGDGCPLEPDYRLPWRERRLRAVDGFTWRVHVPIRYGRKSEKRGDTFTMVVSPERISNPGIGKAIRCVKDVAHPDDLFDEAIALWRAERKSNDGSGVCASWGSVAIIVPPDFLEHDDNEERKALLDGWRERTAAERHYGNLSFSKEDRTAAGTDAIIDEGRLQIPWPRQVSGEELPLDLLLLTATNAEIGTTQSEYPTPEELAAAWNARPEYAGYFHCNRLAGIETADDREIARHLT